MTSPQSGLRLGFVSMHTSPIASPGSADAGGMNVVALNSALALGRRGHQVDLITRRDDPAEPDVVELADNVRLLNLDAGPARHIAKSRQEALIQPFAEALGRLAPYDLLHCHHWFSGVAALEWAHASSMPVVQSFHSVAAPDQAPLSAGEPPESPGRRAGEQRVARDADLVVAVSQAEAHTVRERYGTAEDRLAVVYPGVDLAQFRPLEPGERHWAWDGIGGCYLLFAGRLQPLKAPDLAIRTLAALPTRDRPHLVLAGEASQDFAGYEAQLHALVDELGLRDQVTFLGSLTRPELASMLRGACLLLNPSYSETFGLICLEAEASGVPPVAARHSGLLESVCDGAAGVLVDSRDPQDWARVVRELMDDGEVRARMGAAGRRFASQHSWDHVAQELEDVYARVLEADR